MKQTRSLSEFSCLSEYTRLYPSILKTNTINTQSGDILLTLLWKQHLLWVIDVSVSMFQTVSTTLPGKHIIYYITNYFTFIQSYEICVSYYMVCASVQEDQPQALTSGSSPSQKYKPWNNFLLHQHTFALYALRDIWCKHWHINKRCDTGKYCLNIN